MMKNMEIQVAQKLNISEIVKEYSGRLTGFIRKRVDRMEDAEDILQEVFYQLTEADRLMKPIDQITAWLFTVARNRITDLYRKKKPDFLPEQYSDEEEEIVMEELGEILVNEDNTPENEYIRTVLREEISNVLADLPDEQREVFEMTEFEGLSFKEIAQVTGETVNTLISRKHYAVLYMRKRLRILYEELINL
jgi:RNA polymerase sigma factor (sigma-70 family)